MKPAQVSSFTLLRENSGASWEKRGNTLWLQCGACSTWFPVSVAMTRPDAAAACCPQCHVEFKLATTTSSQGARE